MTFGAAAFLFAGLAAAIPVVLHMINRQRAKELPFSTLRFLRISVEKTRRRRRIQDVLLMLLRMAVLLLIAFGLARPTLTSLKSLLGGGASSAVAIILDNSASMGTIDNDRMRFDTAVGAALQIMDDLHDGDRVALYLTGGPHFPELGKLDRTHEKVRQILNQCAVSYERADLAVKVHDARKLLVKSDAPNKEIFVISDLQELSWEGLKKEQETPAQEDAEKSVISEEERKIREIPVIVVDCNRNPKPNVAVADVDLHAVVPVAGVPVQATVELVNAATVPQPAHLDLYIDGTKQYSSPALSLSPEGRLKHDFQFTFERGGLHRGEVRLAGDDGSKLDDRRFFTMEVDQGIPVAVVKPQRHEIAYLEDSFYVEQALAPARAGGWAIRTTSLTAAELLTEPLPNYTVICCVNVPALDANAAERLRTYVEHGGNLIWICGDNVQPEAYNRMNEDARGELLPAPLLEVRSPQPGEDRDSWSIGFLDKEHKALQHLIEPASLYQSVLIYKHVRIDAAAQNEAWVMARLDDGEPLLVQRTVGQGSVTMLGTSAHVGWTNLPVRPLFLPLLVRLTFELAGAEQARHQALAGAPIVIPFEEQIRPTEVEIVPPSGATTRLHIKPDAEGNLPGSFRYADTHDVGIYTLTLAGVRRTQVAYSVNVDPDEASSAKITREELEERFGGTPLVFADDPDDLSSTLAWLREGTGLWELFLSAVLIALVFETFISNQLSPKQEDDELKHVAPGMRRLAKKGLTAA